MSADQKYLNKQMNASMGCNNLSKTKYRMKRPYSMISNLEMTNQNGIREPSSKKLKSQSGGQFGIGSENYNLGYNFNSVDNKKNMPVFSMNPSNYYNNNLMDIEMNNNISYQNEIKRNQNEKIEKIKNQMKNYQTQIKRTDNPSLYHYECCDDKYNYN